MTEKKILAASVRMIDADVKTLPSGVVEIVPTPGQNKIIIPIGAHLHLKSTAGYTNFDVLMAFQLIRGTLGMPFLSIDQVDLLLGSAVNMDANMIIQPVFDAPVDIIDKPLNLKVTNALGALTGGNSANQLTITVLYWIMHV